MADVHVEMLPFDQPVPAGTMVVRVDRKPDGTPESSINCEAVGQAIKAAHELGYTRVLVEAPPHA
jgi:hypothetical protein